MSKASLLATIKDKASDHVQPFPVQKSNNFLGLKRSSIPKEQCKRVVFHLDEGSQLELSAKAISIGLQPDELLRRLVWLLNEGL